MSFLGVHGGKTNTAHLVFLIVNDFQMGWVYTPSNSAKMVTLFLRCQVFLNEHFVHHAMRVLGLIAHCYAGVAVRVYCASPQPARDTFVDDRGVYLDLLEQTSNASQKRVAFDNRELPGFAFSPRGFTALFTVVPKSVRVFRGAVELSKRFFSQTFAAVFGRDRILSGHHCLLTGDDWLGVGMRLHVSSRPILP